MMLLGLVLHSAASYIQTPIGWAWPYHDPQRNLFFDLLIVVIHLFRMPVFFVMAGFFGALLYDRNGPSGFMRNRVTRVLLPLVTFWPFVIPLTVLGFAFAARQIGTAMPWDVVTELPPLRRPIFGHLWFLYDLLLFYAAALPIVSAAARVPVGIRDRGADLFRAVATRWWGVLVLASVTTITLLPMEAPTIETSAALVPPLRVLAAYGVFFAFGWLLYSHRDLVDSFARRWRSMLAAAAAGTIAYVAVLAARRTLDPAMWHVSGAISGALALWLLILGITGLFVRHLSKPRPLVRYFADASYWMYLLHVIPITWCAGLLAHSGAPASVKFGIVLAVTTSVTVVTYHYFVRSTAVGVLLNGRRYPRRLPDVGRTPQIAGDHEVRGTPVP